VYKRQIEDFIETYWAAVPVDNLADFQTTYKQLMMIKDDTDFDTLLSEYQTKVFAPNIGTVYGQIYRLVEKTLGSRKTVRDFKQIDEPNHKCTLCGVREPVHPGTYNERSCSENFGALRGFWQEKVLPKFPQIRQSERLCAVCSTKRFAASHFFKKIFEEKFNYNISNKFPSVGMIATASFKEKIIKNLENPELYTTVNNFITLLEKLFKGNEDRITGEPVPMIGRMCSNEKTVSINNKKLALDFASLEGDWLYEDSLQDSLKDELTNFSEDVLNNARKLLHNLIKTAEKLGINSPSKYYAILLMDGDNMGKWLSGEFAPAIGDVLHPVVKNTRATNPDLEELLKQKRPLNPALHLATSKALRDFSLHVVREIVERDHLGKLVYAGGDDVLAFINLRDLPEVMRKLRAYFSGSLVVNEETNRVDIDFKEGKGFVPVDEDGIPLNVGNNERKIKGFMLSMGTNATASMGVVIAHHNSNLSQVLDEVRKSEKEAKKIKGKNAFCIALEKRAGEMEHISAKWYYDDNFESILLLRQWSDAFFKDWISPKLVYTFRTETKELEGLHEAIRYELIRIADRHRNTKAQDFTKEQMTDLVDGLMNLHKNGISLYNIVNFLSVAKFLGEGENR